jgi:nucleotide-binding universal stress UspA family protein
MEQAAAAARSSGVRFEPVVLRAQGHSVAEVIVAHARKQKVDVIVLGTHGAPWNQACADGKRCRASGSVGTRSRDACPGQLSLGTPDEGR